MKNFLIVIGLAASLAAIGFELYILDMVLEMVRVIAAG